ncbi:NAD(P)H-binding protein [Paenibacillus endoradicis]|uniref:NAD(P)H-binding protein n=1 Tax=Paenibacillus endoradicis TaxID=2972487 RepID=UPI002159580A|nr:NAD(P)H-binding protein [Paenibacillus endoradicis]MCR8660430.1 NAD(P)H-binding protein [Paenibacillus endoradicis]
MALKAVIVGATGLVGRELVRVLLNAKKYEKVIVIARRRLSIVHPRLEQQLIQFDQMHECPEEWFKDADVFCTLGTTIKKAGSTEQFEKVDYHYVIEIAKLAKLYYSRKFIVVTAMGSDDQSKIFYNRVKGKTELELQQLQLPQLIIVRPSLILGDRNEARFGESVAAKLMTWLSFMFKGKMRKYKPIQARDIAIGMFKLAKLCKDPLIIVSSEEIEVWSKKKLYK